MTFLNDIKKLATNVMAELFAPFKERVKYMFQVTDTPGLNLGRYVNFRSVFDKMIKEYVTRMSKLIIGKIGQYYESLCTELATTKWASSDRHQSTIHIWHKPHQINNTDKYSSKSGTLIPKAAKCVFMDIICTDLFRDGQFTDWNEDEHNEPWQDWFTETWNEMSGTNDEGSTSAEEAFEIEACAVKRDQLNEKINILQSMIDCIIKEFPPENMSNKSPSKTSSSSKSKAAAAPAPRASSPFRFGSGTKDK